MPSFIPLTHTLREHEGCLPPTPSSLKPLHPPPHTDTSEVGMKELNMVKELWTRGAHSLLRKAYDGYRDSGEELPLVVGACVCMRAGMVVHVRVCSCVLGV